MRDMYWLTSPSFVVPYTLLLVVIVAVTVVRAGWLSWRLFGGVPRRRIPLDRALDGSVSADDLARAALANLASHETPPQERLAELRALPRVELDAALRTLGMAYARFDYRCPGHWRVVDVEPDAADAHRGGVHHGVRVLSQVAVLLMGR